MQQQQQQQTDKFPGDKPSNDCMEATHSEVNYSLAGAGMLGVGTPGIEHLAGYYRLGRVGRGHGLRKEENV